MAASISDYFNKASNMNGSYPPVATVSAARSSGGTTLTCNSLSGWATDTPVHFSTFKVNTDGTINTASQTDWKGIVKSNTITEMKRLAGAADSGNASGDRVELNPTIGWLDDLITGLLVAHTQTGAIKSSAVGTNALAASAVTTAKINNSAITSAKIASAAVTADKIDWTALYPVGAIYLSTSSANPSTFMSGTTWTQIKDVFLLAAGSKYSAGSTGGEATHTLTVNEMPSHNHQESIYYGSNGSKTAHGTAYNSTMGTVLLETASAGGGAAHNNMPPYLAVYVWKRTA